MKKAILFFATLALLPFFSLSARSDVTPQNVNRLDATALVFHTEGQIFGKALIEKYESELLAIRLLRIPGIEKSHIYYDLPDNVEIEPSEAYKNALLKKLKKGGMSEGDLDVTVKKTGIRDLDALLSQGKFKVREVVHLASYEGDQDSVRYTVALDVTNLDYASFSEGLKKITEINKFEFQDHSRHPGTIIIGTNNPGIQRLEDENGLARYVFWEAYGDCMAGCRGRYYYFTVTKYMDGYTARRVTSVNDSISIWGVPNQFSPRSFSSYNDMMSYAHATDWWIRLNVAGVLYELLAGAYYADYEKDVKAHSNDVKAYLEELASQDPDSRVREFAKNVLSKLRF